MHAAECLARVSTCARVTKPMGGHMVNQAQFRIRHIVSLEAVRIVVGSMFVATGRATGMHMS